MASRMRGHCLALFALPLLLCCWAAACTSAPSSTAQKPVTAASPEVVAQLRSGAEVHVKVELAQTEGERARGLMFRRSLEGGAGMLFVFPKNEVLKFWMRNTYIPLDMIFLDEQRKVIYVEENAEPLTETPRGPDIEGRYVVEVPGGWARTHGIEPGIIVRFVGVSEPASH